MTEALTYLFALILMVPIMLRLYRNLVRAFTWPIDKDFRDEQEYVFGPDFPRGW